MMAGLVRLLFVLIFTASVLVPATAAAETRRVILHQQADYHGFDYETLMDVGLEACQSASSLAQV